MGDELLVAVDLDVGLAVAGLDVGVPAPGAGVPRVLEPVHPQRVDPLDGIEVVGNVADVPAKQVQRTEAPEVLPPSPWGMPNMSAGRRLRSPEPGWTGLATAFRNSRSGSTPASMALRVPAIPASAPWENMLTGIFPPAVAAACWIAAAVPSMPVWRDWPVADSVEVETRRQVRDLDFLITLLVGGGDQGRQRTAGRVPRTTDIDGGVSTGGAARNRELRPPKRREPKQLPARCDASHTSSFLIVELWRSRPTGDADLSSCCRRQIKHIIA